MEDDTIYSPRNEFEWEMKEKKGMPYFRQYRQQLEVEKQKETEIIEDKNTYRL